MKTLKYRELKAYVLQFDLPLDTYCGFVNALYKMEEVGVTIHVRNDYLKMIYKNLKKGIDK